MTPDVDALLAPARWDPRRCVIPQALEEVADEAARSKVAAAALDPRVPQANVAKALSMMVGDRISHQSVQRHRSRRCHCP